MESRTTPLRHRCPDPFGSRLFLPGFKGLMEHLDPAANISGLKLRPGALF